MCRCLLLQDNTLLQGNKNLGPRIGPPHEPEDYQPFWKSLGPLAIGVPVNRYPVSTGSGVPRLGGTRLIYDLPHANRKTRGATSPRGLWGGSVLDENANARQAAKLTGHWLTQLSLSLERQNKLSSFGFT